MASFVAIMVDGREVNLDYDLRTFRVTTMLIFFCCIYGSSVLVNSIGLFDVELIWGTMKKVEYICDSCV